MTKLQLEQIWSKFKFSKLLNYYLITEILYINKITSVKPPIERYVLMLIIISIQKNGMNIMYNRWIVRSSVTH